jgi:hypothetical protein
LKKATSFFLHLKPMNPSGSQSAAFRVLQQQPTGESIMKKVALCLVLVLGIAAAAQAQCVSNKLVEQMYLVKIAGEAELDAYDMAEMMAGYALYRDMMDGLEAEMMSAKAALDAAVAAGDEGAASDALEALMGANEDIFSAKQEAITESATLLGDLHAAKLFTPLFSPCKAKKAMLNSLDPQPVCAVAPCAVAAAPCAVAATPAMSPEEEVMAAIKEIVAAVLAGNVDGLLGFVSEEFYHPEVGDLDSVKDYIEMGREAGYLDDVPGLIEEHGGEISLEDAEIEIKDGEASVYPIDAMSNQGAVSVELILKKEADGKWRVIGGDVDGI